MAILLTAQDLQKSFGVRPLFKNLSFVVESRDRIGLIGSNGAGKSTLLKILSGKMEFDEGTLSVQKGLKIGFLEQTPILNQNLTIQEEIISGAIDPSSAEAHALTSQWIAMLNLESQGLSAETLVKKLSGGWQKKVALARELVKEPELLLLDEPTNHLDLESILWLEELLIRAPFAAVIITHDRVFLQKVTTRMFELGRQYPQGVLDVRGDYATYLDLRETQLSQQRTEEVVLKNKLRRETEWLRRGAKARTTKQQARIGRALDLQQDVKELEYRNRSREISIEFQSSQKQPNRLIEARNISKSYGHRKLFSDFNLFLGPGTRLGILGMNGCGKSTLIRCLLGDEPVDSGNILRAEQLTVAYFEQKRESLDLSQSVQKTLCPGGDTVIYRGKPIHIRGYLDRFLFSAEQIELPVGKLSGGEQARLLLARLMLKEAKILVLDEPTNDLDIETLDVLQSCLTEFEGAVVLVTHDRYFLDQVATEIIAFSGKDLSLGTLIKFADLSQWEKWYEENQQVKEVKKIKIEDDEPKKKKKMSYHEVRELGMMEEKIQSAEKKLAELQNEVTQPEIQSNSKRLTELYQQIAESQERVDLLYSRWSELEKKAHE
jgi:ABC transport system ATP-binding/permease protein